MIIKSLPSHWFWFALIKVYTDVSRSQGRVGRNQITVSVFWVLTGSTRTRAICHHHHHRRPPGTGGYAVPAASCRSCSSMLPLYHKYIIINIKSNRAMIQFGTVIFNCSYNVLSRVICELFHTSNSIYFSRKTKREIIAWIRVIIR